MILETRALLDILLVSSTSSFFFPSIPYVVSPLFGCTLESPGVLTSKKKICMSKVPPRLVKSESWLGGDGEGPRRLEDLQASQVTLTCSQLQACFHFFASFLFTTIVDL